MMDRMPDGPWKGVMLIGAIVLLVAFLWGAAEVVAAMIVFG